MYNYLGIKVFSPDIRLTSPHYPCPSSPLPRERGRGVVLSEVEGPGSWGEVVC